MQITISGIFKSRIQCEVYMNKLKASLDWDDFGNCRSKNTFPQVVANVRTSKWQRKFLCFNCSFIPNTKENGNIFES